FTLPAPPNSTLFPYTTLFRSRRRVRRVRHHRTSFPLGGLRGLGGAAAALCRSRGPHQADQVLALGAGVAVLGSDPGRRGIGDPRDRKSTRLNSSHLGISYAVF